ncbi:hypothetical protein U1Q18_035305 [Sarracenia purpurea var. burkii]
MQLKFITSRERLGSQVPDLDRCGRVPCRGKPTKLEQGSPQNPGSTTAWGRKKRRRGFGCGARPGGNNQWPPRASSMIPIGGLETKSIRVADRGEKDHLIQRSQDERSDDKIIHKLRGSKERSHERSESRSRLRPGDGGDDDQTGLKPRLFSQRSREREEGDEFDSGSLRPTPQSQRREQVCAQAGGAEVAVPPNQRRRGGSSEKGKSDQVAAGRDGRS